jgi:hypothetical protein
MPVRWNWLQLEESGKSVLEHLECKLFEVTITVAPMNELAELTAAKSLDLIASKVQDIAEQLESPEGVALSPEEKAAIFQETLGQEAAVLGKSLTDLSAQMERLLTPSKPEDTSAHGAEADLRQRKLETEKRRLALEEL